MNQSRMKQSRSDHASIGLGAIGLGGFARFALQHFIQVPGVELVCVGGATSDEAKHCAERYGVAVLESAAAVCEREDVNWVYINTPPFLHAEQTLLALRHGKNVLVEKPMATTIEDGREIQTLAAKSGLRVVTNLMQRHNPVVKIVKTIIEEKLFGDPLFFNFNNHAVDEGLPTEHWFWDRHKSGGIFVEHGVHFFDMARYWFGDGTVRSAGAHCRGVDGCEDQVWCDVMHGQTLARFYHGFNQTSRTESQRWEIVFERGQILMEGWIPMGLVATAIVSERETRRLMELDPDARCRIVEQYAAADRVVHGHGTDHDVFQKVSWRSGPADDKSRLYGDLLVEMMSQQVCDAGKVDDPATLVGDSGGLRSLELAVEASRMAADE